MAKEVALAALSPLEKEIAIMVAKGLKNREVAEKLGVAEQTVRNYLCVIYEKAGINNRAGLTNWAWDTGLVGKPPSDEE